MNPGKVLAFLKKSDKGTYYSVYRRVGIFPVKENRVNWGIDKDWSQMKKLTLKEVLEDIKKTQQEIKIASSK